MKKRVIFGFLGTKLDMGFHPDRWDRWRPTVALCAREDVEVARLELFYEPRYHKLGQQIISDIRQISPTTEVRSNQLGITKPWDFEDVFLHLHEFLTNYKFDLEHEEYFAHITTGTHVAQICLFLLIESHHLPGKILQTGPSPGRNTKNITGTESIIDLDLSRYDALVTRFNTEQAEAQNFLKSGIATQNEAFNRLIEQIEVVAIRSTAPILLTGPTGAGKSQLARRLYELRQQRCGLNGNFVEINCATLRGDTAMSTLFGHKKGAYTGAQSDRPGLLREANGGLLFLDEIGELGVDEQAMLLRAIEEGVYLPVGADKPVKSKFQLIAGTNRDLHKEVTHGTFREDLLARINTWTFQLPGLAERREDIEPNLDYELNQFSKSSGRKVTFNKEARSKFLKFATACDTPWRGNFRDLNAAITRMATLAPRGRISVEEVDDEFTRLRASWQRDDEPSNNSTLLQEVLETKTFASLDPFDAVQLDYVIKVCRQCKTISEAGRMLFSESRKTKKSSNDSDRLRKYLSKFKLDFESVQKK